jgi:acetyl esterase
MQNITRVWAKELNTAVLSVDYRRPPEHPFPAALDDVFIVYQFAITQLRKYCNIDPS